MASGCAIIKHCRVFATDEWLPHGALRQTSHLCGLETFRGVQPHDLGGVDFSIDSQEYHNNDTMSRQVLKPS
jgi:hypothetical protein